MEATASKTTLSLGRYSRVSAFGLWVYFAGSPTPLEVSMMEAGGPCQYFLLYPFLSFDHELNLLSQEPYGEYCHYWVLKILGGCRVWR